MYKFSMALFDVANVGFKSKEIQTFSNWKLCRLIHIWINKFYHRFNAINRTMKIMASVYGLLLEQLMTLDPA